MPSTMSLPVESLCEGAELPSRRIVLQPWRKSEMRGKLWQVEKPNLVCGQQCYGNVGETVGGRRLISSER